jgi:hypothetical protein
MHGYNTLAICVMPISSSRLHMNCDRALDGRIIAKIERLGVLIGVVKDRRALVGQTQAHNGENESR